MSPNEIVKSPGTGPLGPTCQNAWYRWCEKRSLKFLFPAPVDRPSCRRPDPLSVLPLGASQWPPKASNVQIASWTERYFASTNLAPSPTDSSGLSSDPSGSRTSRSVLSGRLVLSTTCVRLTGLLWILMFSSVGNQRNHESDSKTAKSPIPIIRKTFTSSGIAPDLR